MKQPAIQRRSFLKAAFSVGVLAATAGLSGCGQISGSQEQSSPQKTAEALPQNVADATTKSFDVVIVGAGGAGMCAALGASQKGASVVLLEKSAFMGGNTNFAEGGMNAANTRFQREQGIEDTPELFVEETIAGGHGLNDRELVTFLANNSSDSIDWLDGQGLTLNKIGKSGGFSVPRLHRPSDGSPVGAFLVAGLSKLCEQAGIHIVTDLGVTKIVRDDKNVITGVEGLYKEKTPVKISGKAVVLTTGGFGANQEMVAKYRPDLKGTVTTNMNGAQGDGIRMAQEIGAAAIDLDQIQIHPTVEQKTSTLLTEAVRGDGAVLINSRGERFVDEMKTRDRVSAAELDQPGKFAFCVFDDKIARNTKSVEEEFKKNNLALVANTLDELAQLMEVDKETFKRSLEAYNTALSQGTEDPFGRTMRGEVIDTPPFVAIKIAPGIHHCMGGLKINTHTQVLDEQGNVIPGLFAAGEVTGGVHGGNRIGGNAVCDIVTYGRTSSESVSEYIKSV